MPTDIAELNPFPREDDLRNLSREEMAARGELPPFHSSCFAEGTEVYTNEGWKLFENLNMGELFLSRKGNGELEWVKAVKYIEYLYQGDLYKLTTNSMKLIVTPAHKQPFESRVEHSSFGRRREAFMWTVEKMLTRNEYNIPRTGLWIGSETCTKEFAKFLAYYLKDKVYVAGNPELGKWLMEFGHSNEKYIPSMIKEATAEIIKEFLLIYADGDGYCKTSRWKEKKLKSENYCFYTASKKMGEDLGELILKVGGYPSFTIEKKAGNEMICPRSKKIYKLNHDVYKINWNKSKFASSQHIKVEKIKYDGFVRDVELEKNHVLFVRYEGKTVFSGNCRCDVVPLWGDKVIDIYPAREKWLIPKIPEVVKWVPVRTVIEAEKQLKEKFNIENIEFNFYDAEIFKERSKVKDLNQIGKSLSEINESIPTFSAKTKKLSLKNLSLYPGPTVDGDYKKIIKRDFSDVGTANGRYWRKKRRFEIALQNSTSIKISIGKGEWNVGENISGVTRHEYGHHYWYNGLTNNQKNEFIAFLAGEYPLPAKFGNAVSEYAFYEKKVEEGFAEVFSGWTSSQYGKNNNKFPENIEKIMEKLVGKRK